MTRRTQFTGTADSRRREARKHLQALPVNDFSTGLDLSPAAPSKAELTCKRKPAMRAVVATITTRTKHYPSADNICLADVAIFNAGYRTDKYNNPYHVIKG